MADTKQITEFEDTWLNNLSPKYGLGLYETNDCYQTKTIENRYVMINYTGSDWLIEFKESEDSLKRFSKKHEEMIGGRCANIAYDIFQYLK